MKARKARRAKKADPTGSSRTARLARLIGTHLLRHFTNLPAMNTQFVNSLGAKFAELIRAGLQTPGGIAVGLNTASIKTACGEEWTPDLAAHLWRILIGTEPPQDPKLAKESMRGPRRLQRGRCRRTAVQPGAGVSKSFELGAEPPRASVPDVNHILHRISEMSAIETVELWRNALRTLDDAAMSPRHAGARIVLRAVQDEWERREAHLRPNEDGFAWPSTRADGGSGTLATENWLREGLLKFMGYSVGDANGKDDSVRQRMLAAIFDGPIPPAFPRDYMAKWSRPGTPARLKQLAETLAAFARNAKRRREANMVSAVRDWETDLEFLYHKFYRGRFGFGWPGTMA
jgi:hypothetical protein